jgi:hypothetical protein
MCETPVESKNFSIKAGSIIQIDGTPYALANETVVSGFEEPRWPSVFEGPNAHDQRDAAPRNFETTNNLAARLRWNALLGTIGEINMYAVHSVKQAQLTGESEYLTPDGRKVIVTSVENKPGCPSIIWDDKKDLGEVTCWIRKVSFPVKTI